MACTYVTFPVLRALMARFGLNYATIGEVIPNKDTGEPLSYQTVSTRINRTFGFDLREMVLIRDYFNLCIEKEEVRTQRETPRVTIQEIFFDWLDSYEDMTEWKTLNTEKAI